MTAYIPPLRDINFVVNEVAGLGRVSALPGFEDATPDVVAAVLEESARLAEEVLAPLNRIGDQQGSRLESGQVHPPEGFAEAYRSYAEGGWTGLQGDPEHGGQGLPALLGAAVQEMWQSANMSFALCPLLTHGAIEALEHHGSESQKALFLPRLMSGEWTGTMNLTEPQAGSDLAAVRTRAERQGDHYRIRGQKIFITWGDHDMADNIVHLVLARTPDAPQGVKGISMFLVPKFLVDENGNIGEANDLRPVSLEHKLGIHGSPTCVMSYGDHEGAVGYLIGEENQGLPYMFTMMNSARLNVGIQGLAVAERAYQQARDYARERVQGYLPGEPGRVTIIHHPDVRRQLMFMKASVEAMRALAYSAYAAADLGRRSPDQGTRAFYQARVDLMTPLVKGWCTELGQEVASVGVQVHGGMGYVEETGAAQYFRDARITTIYEGTTAIQANDLVHRKLLRDGGAAAAAMIEEMRGLDGLLAAAGDGFQVLRQGLAEHLGHFERVLRWLPARCAEDPHAAGAASVNLLLGSGYLAGGWKMAAAALAAGERLASGEGDTEFLQAKLVTARFYFEHLLPRARAHLSAVMAGSGSMMAMPEAQF